MPDLGYAERVPFLSLLRNEYRTVIRESKKHKKKSFSDWALLLPSVVDFDQLPQTSQHENVRSTHLQIRSPRGHHNFWLAGPPFCLVGSEKRVQSATIIGWSRVIRVGCLHSPIIASDYFRRLVAAGGVKIVLLHLSFWWPTSAKMQI